MSPSLYSDLVSSYKYVASVRGNGVDTHRLWETLYRGGIPIITRDSWQQSLSHLQLPILTIGEWSLVELLSTIQTEQIAEYIPADLPALWWNYWKNSIKEFV